MITAITELEDGKLVSILDVEQILSSVVGESRMPDIPQADLAPDQFVFFVDDSVVARKEITSVLDKMRVKYARPPMVVKHGINCSLLPTVNQQAKAAWLIRSN